MDTINEFWFNYKYAIIAVAILVVITALIRHFIKDKPPMTELEKARYNAYSATIGGNSLAIVAANIALAKAEADERKRLEAEKSVKS